MRAPVNLQEHVLRRILGRRRVSEEALQEGEDAIEVGLEEGFERERIAAPHPLEVDPAWGVPFVYGGTANLSRVPGGRFHRGSLA